MYVPSLLATVPMTWQWFKRPMWVWASEERKDSKRSMPLTSPLHSLDFFLFYYLSMGGLTMSECVGLYGTCFTRMYVTSLFYLFHAYTHTILSCVSFFPYEYWCTFYKAPLTFNLCHAMYNLLSHCTLWLLYSFCELCRTVPRIDEFCITISSPRAFIYPHFSYFFNLYYL